MTKKKEKETSIDQQVLSGIYEELLNLKRQVGDITLLLHKNDIITKDEAWAIINMRPEEDDT